MICVRSRREVRIKILADRSMSGRHRHRAGNRPFLPKVPFVPGYDIVGVVDASAQG